MTTPQEPSPSDPTWSWGTASPSPSGKDAGGAGMPGDPGVPPETAPYGVTPAPYVHDAPPPPMTTPYPSGDHGTPHGQDRSAANAYGLATTNRRRPASVAAAAVLTIVSCAFAALLLVLAGVVALVGAVFIARSDDGTSVEGMGDAFGVAAGAAGVVLLACAVPAAAAIGLAVGVLRGSSGARTGLVVLSIMAAVVYLGVAVLAGAGGDPLTATLAVVYLVVCVATAVLLLNRDSRTWFAGGGPGAAFAAGPGYGGPPPGSAPWGPGPQGPGQPWG
ncbi:hypothetical protein ACOACO_01220 [Nocardioides sp. CPCC 205120]|uniref:hypothetical protein n=1 Tax=Nocardioides sp. CPCC 205120 TaxID=3406462 RepID=UPI003B50AC40